MSKPDIPQSLDFDGRNALRIEEVAERLAVTSRHVSHLIEEGTLQAVDVRSGLAGREKQRPCWRIPIESYREFVRRRLM
jgi:excisionase family DNA binding protein